MIRRFHAQGRPFFLNVWWLDPHEPYEPAPEPHWSATAAQGIREAQHRFRSMVRHLDAKIGQILSTLDELGIADNTLVVFLSDNGGAYEANLGGLRGGKTDLHEGGIRVPMIAAWPDQIPSGGVSREVGHSNDVLPTLCAAAGIDVPADLELDGANLLPLLTGEQAALRRETVFWQLDLYERLQRHDPKPKPYATEAARRGKWKLLARDGVGLELFDIDADANERHNLLAMHPDIVSQLESQLKTFLAEPRRAWNATPPDKP